MEARDATERLLPLKPDVFAVLLVLLDGPAHGYAIMQRARASGRGRGLRPGALYRVLKRMLDDELIAESERGDEAGAGDERRRIYRISSFGREVAAAEARRLESLVAASRARQLLDGEEPA